MQFSKEKYQKNENGSMMLLINPSFQSMDCVIRCGNRFINSTGNFFVCLKMFIMQQREKQLEIIKRIFFVTAIWLLHI